MATFYQVTLNGKYAGQDVKNILWYRDTSVFATALNFYGMMNALLASIRAQIWFTQSPLHTRGAGLQEIMPVGYELESISGLAYDDAHLLISDTPVIENVGEFGLATGATNGPANYVSLTANLEPSFGPGIGLPKKGYLAIGPIRDADVGDDGRLVAGAVTGMNDLGRNLATNVITTLPASVFFPIRVKLVYSPHLPGEDGVLLSIGYKDINNFTTRPIVKQRKSRLPEA